MSLISGDDDRGDDVLGVVDRDDVFGVVTLDDVFGVDDLDVVRDAKTFPTPTTSSFDDSSDVGVDDDVVVMTLPTSMFKSLLKLLSDKFALSMFKLLRSLVKLGNVLASTETLRRWAADDGDDIRTLLELVLGSVIKEIWVGLALTLSHHFNIRLALPFINAFHKSTLITIGMCDKFLQKLI